MSRNYFFGVIGSLLQRMTDDHAHYALAIPDAPPFINLVARFPELARRYIDREGKRRSVYSTIPEPAPAKPRAKRDEAIRRAELGIVHNPRLTLGDLLERWLAEVAPLRLRPSSLERYRGIIRGQLVPTLGRIPLASLTPSTWPARTPTSPPPVR